MVQTFGREVTRKKVRAAVLDMMSKVKIDGDHNYTRVGDGKWLAGVSSIAETVVPKPWLAAWGAKEAVKFLGYTDDGAGEHTHLVLSKIKGMNPDEFCDFLKEAKGASARKSKDAKLDGTAGHAWLEEFVKAKIRGAPLPQIPDGNLKRPIEQFLVWEKDNVDEWVLSEARVADVEKEFAGTLDAVAILRGDKLAMVDFKFATAISDSFNLQMAGYCVPFEAYKIKFDARVIVRLPKTETKQEYDKKIKRYKTVLNEIEIKEVNTPYDFDRETFLAARSIYRWLNYLEKSINKS